MALLNVKQKTDKNNRKPPVINPLNIHTEHNENLANYIIYGHKYKHNRKKSDNLNVLVPQSVQKEEKKVNEVPLQNKPNVIANQNNQPIIPSKEQSAQKQAPVAAPSNNSSKDGDLKAQADLLKGKAKAIFSGFLSMGGKKH